MTYSVVELFDGVVIIPTKWMIRGENGKIYCFYPSKNDVGNMNNWIKKLSDPGKNWQTYEIVNHLKTTDTLEKAKNKLLESLILSEVDSDMTNNYDEKFKKSRQERAKKSSPDNTKGFEKRILNKNRETKPKIIEDLRLGSDNKLILPPVCKRQRLNTMEEDISVENSKMISEMESETMDNHVRGYKRMIDRDADGSSSVNFIVNLKKDEQLKKNPQQNQKPVETSTPQLIINFSLPGSSNETQFEVITQVPVLISHNPEVRPEEVQQKPKEDTSANKIKPLSSKSADSVQLSEAKSLKEAGSEKVQQKRKEATSQNKNHLASMTYHDKKSGLSYEELSLSKLNEIILLLRNIKLQSPLANDAACGPISFLDSEDCPTLPVKTKEELTSLNDKLARKSLRKRMIQALGSIGGRNLNNVVANICSKLFSNEVALLYSWSGRKKPKLSLEETKFAKLILSSVQANNSKYIEQNIKDAASQWFAQAKTRSTRKAANQDEDQESQDEESENEKDEARGDADDEQD